MGGPRRVTMVEQLSVRAIGVGGVAMALEVDGDHLVDLGQPGDHRSETRVGVQHSAVQHDERSTRSVDLVIRPMPLIDTTWPFIAGLASVSSRPAFRRRR